MAFHAENNWFRSAEKLISTDFWLADGSEGDAPLFACVHRFYLFSILETREECLFSRTGAILAHNSA